MSNRIKGLQTTTQPEEMDNAGIATLTKSPKRTKITLRKYPNNGATVGLSLRVDPELKERLEEIAHEKRKDFDLRDIVISALAAVIEDYG